jgi:hypothetical protein
MAQFITVKTTGAFVAEYCIRWNGGQTEWSGEIAVGEANTWNMQEVGVPEGTSVWAVAAVLAGPNNHESGDNATVTYDGTSCGYSCGGTAPNPSFSGCD